MAGAYYSRIVERAEYRRADPFYIPEVVIFVRNQTCGIANIVFDVVVGEVNIGRIEVL